MITYCKSDYFANYDEVDKWVADWIASKNQNNRHNIQLLPKKWEKCVASEGKYFDLSVKYFVFEIIKVTRKTVVFNATP